MKKIIGQIQKEDAEELISLNCNLQSLVTLIKIKDKPIPDNIIYENITIINEKIKLKWEFIYNKYNIPFYIDRIINVDYENSCLYYEDTI